MSLPSTYQVHASMASPRPRVAQSPPGSPARGKDGSSVASPFTPSSNPNFQPQKMTVKNTPATPASAPKPPKPPEKPLMPYMRYSKSVWETARSANPELKLWEIGKVIGSMWRELSEDKKQEFQEQYESEKIDYEKALKLYHSSSAYQAYLVEKTKAKKAEEHAVAPGAPEKPSSSGSSKSSAPPSERRIEIQPAEDDDDQDEGFSVKHVSHTRYLRNHRLMSEIFSEALVPDVRSVVTNSRMQVLKRQVLSLTMHQQKLEDELQQIEEKFESKKKNFVKASDSFRADLRRLCSQVLDQDAFQAICDEQFELLKRKSEDEKRKQEPARKKQFVAPSQSHASPLEGPTGSRADSPLSPVGTPNTATAVHGTPVSLEETVPYQNLSSAAHGSGTVSVGCDFVGTALTSAGVPGESIPPTDVARPLPESRDTVLPAPQFRETVGQGQQYSASFLTSESLQLSCQSSGPIALVPELGDSNLNNKEAFEEQAKTQQSPLIHQGYLHLTQTEGTPEDQEIQLGESLPLEKAVSLVGSISPDQEGIVERDEPIAEDHQQIISSDREFVPRAQAAGSTLLANAVESLSDISEPHIQATKMVRNRAVMSGNEFLFAEESHELNSESSDVPVCDRGLLSQTKQQNMNEKLIQEEIPSEPMDVSDVSCETVVAVHVVGLENPGIDKSIGGRDTESEALSVATHSMELSANDQDGQYSGLDGIPAQIGEGIRTK